VTVRIAMAIALGWLAAMNAMAAEPCPRELHDKAKLADETPAQRQERLELEMVVNVEAMYQGCSLSNPEFVSLYAAPYGRWRAKYREAIARYEKDARARRYVECGVDFERKRMTSDDAQARAEKAQVCRIAGSSIENITPHATRKK
jgi:hypothetical protein